MNIRTTTMRRLRDALLKGGQRPTVVLSEAYETLARQGLLTADQTAVMSRVDPAGEVMFLVMAADGTIAEEEKDVIRGALRALTDGDLRSGTINVMLDEYAERLKKEGRDERLEQVAAELAETPIEAEVAFSLAAAVALADDRVAREENRLLDEFATMLGLSSERSTTILVSLKKDQQAEEGEE